MTFRNAEFRVLFSAVKATLFAVLQKELETIEKEVNTTRKNEEGLLRIKADHEERLEVIKALESMYGSQQQQQVINETVGVPSTLGHCNNSPG